MRRKANSLVEVLIVLGIISTTMLMSINILIGLLSEIRRNEIEDSSNNIMLQGLEIAKSPLDVLITGGIPVKGIASYYFLERDTNNILKKINNGSVLENCEESSDYRIKFKTQTALDLFLTCLQIEIVLDTNESSKNDFYRIRSRIVYKIPSEKDFSINTIEGYRFENFKEI